MREAPFGGEKRGQGSGVGGRGWRLRVRAADITVAVAAHRGDVDLRAGAGLHRAQAERVGNLAAHRLHQVLTGALRLELEVGFQLGDEHVEPALAGVHLALAGREQGNHKRESYEPESAGDEEDEGERVHRRPWWWGAPS